ncbi:MAG: SDR family oxidoreductase [Planctomycetes bacterium]|nr:SDR family oxidoreductase [Planctomycetota bacterium]
MGGAQGGTQGEARHGASAAQFSLAGRTCVVTGGGTGIGRGIALQCAAAGATVAVVGRREELLRETVAQVEAQRGAAIARSMDVTDAGQVAAGMAELAGELGGRIDVLVNNAGLGGPNACSTPGEDRWDVIVRTNLDGTFFCCREALRAMPDGGRIINISSVLGKFGVPGYTAYCASKHGLVGFTKALALEVAPRRITVNAICPGWVETEMARSGMRNLADALGTTYEDARAQALGAVPLQRILEPAEIGALVVYLASPAASGVTAQSWSICGGQVQS